MARKPKAAEQPAVTPPVAPEPKPEQKSDKPEPQVLTPNPFK